MLDHLIQTGKELFEGPHTRKATLRRNRELDPPGMLRISGWVDAKFSQDFFMHRFPFDLQSLRIGLRLPGARAAVPHGAFWKAHM